MADIQSTVLPPVSHACNGGMHDALLRVYIRVQTRADGYTTIAVCEAEQVDPNQEVPKTVGWRPVPDDQGPIRVSGLVVEAEIRGLFSSRRWDRLKGH